MKQAIKQKPQEAPRPGQNAAMDGAILAQLAALQNMPVNDLKAKWQELFSRAAPNNSRSFLEARLACKIQELSYGGITRDTRRELDLLADEYEGKIDRKRMSDDARNPSPGTKLIREWNGAEHVVTVHADGYEWKGRRFRSLSAIAKDITGTSWNGFRFFGLHSKNRSGK